MNWLDTITLDGLDRAGNLERWRQLVRQYALSARTFEVHCWEDEEAAISLAQAHGTEEARDWPRGRVFAGTVTPAFWEMLLSQPLPKGSDLCAVPLTPFFTVAFDNGFWSEHYGTEINIETKEGNP